jgi:hypothetical protein
MILNLLCIRKIWGPLKNIDARHLLQTLCFNGKSSRHEDFFKVIKVIPMCSKVSPDSSHYMEETRVVY